MAMLVDRRTVFGGAAAAVAGVALEASFANARGAGVLRPGALPNIPDVPAATPQSVGMAPDLTARINAVIQRAMDAGRQSGGVTAVARRGKLIHFAAHGPLDIEAGTPMTGDRMFRMMSSTKPVTAVALLQQIEAGTVSLDDKVSRFLPELKDLRVRVSPPGAPVETVPANREITIRDLATHTSGLNRYPDIPPGTPYTLAARVPYARNLTLEFQPGTKWAYSPVIGSDILARVVEMQSGLTYDRYLKERIFEPVGMRDTAHNLADEQRARVVPRYKWQDGKWQRQPSEIPIMKQLFGFTEGPNPKTTYFCGAGGLFSTARDYLLFETMLLNKGTIHGKRVLRPESVALMSTNLVGDLFDGHGAYPYPLHGNGFGILVRTIIDPAICECGRSKGAFGWGGAYGTTSWTDPANRLVAVFLVQQRDDAVEVEFEKAIAGALVA